MSKTALKVTCFGNGKGSKGQEQYEAMWQVGRLLAQNGIVVVTGGYGGSGMEAPCRGAREAEGNTIGYVLRNRPVQPNQYLKEMVVVMDTHFPQEMQYSVRLGHLLESNGFVVDPSDLTPGTLIEFFSVVNLNVKGIWKGSPRPIVVLEYPREEGVFPEWFEAIILHFVETMKLSCSWLHVARKPEDAVEWLMTHFSTMTTRV